MGKSFIYIKENGLSLRKAYNRLKGFEVSESSTMSLSVPDFKEVLEIEIGTDGTDISLIRLNDGGFVAVEGTFPIGELRQ